ncbi:MAG TPA: hypothetical protein GYA07_01245 [Verrucomicrobia bacterium]|nr:hypothetical protein [Verrucomicrobiota bacterium]
MALDAAVFEQTGLGLRIWFSDGVNGFAALDPVQPLTPTPYAISALYANALLGTLPASQLTGTLPPGQLSGVYSGPVTFNNANNSFTGTLSGDGSGVTNIQAGALALTSTNLSVVAWGFESLPELSANNVPDEVDNPVQVAAGFAHSLALNANGTVIAWGRGHIYDSGSTADYGQSIVPADLTNAISVAAGFLHSLALRSDGTVVAWGAGKTNGVLPERGQSIVPPGLNDVVAIAGGFLHSLALRSDGTVVAWGAGLVNQPDNGQDFGQSSVPPGLNNVVAISAGQAHSLALKSDGTVVAWGAGGPGGTNGFDVGQSTVPPGLSNVVAIAAGAVHSLALKADGTVVAWGAGFTNDPSTGLHFGQSIVPPGLSNVVAISAGYVHSLALKSDGTVVAWGAETGSFAFGQSDVPPGLNNVAALGSCSMALHSIALRRRSSAPVAWLDSDNTFNGNVTINGHVRISGPAQLGGDLRLNDRNIWFRGGEDTRNGLGWYGAGKVFTFLPGLPEGPVLFGAQGGVLGTAGTNGSQATLVWNEAGNVAIGGLPLPDVRLSLGTDPAPTKITFGGAGLGFSDSQFRLTLPHDGASFTFHAAPIGFERVRIQGNGDVGIGTSAPGARLDVRGDIRLGLFGEYLVPAGVENLKIIRGRLAPDGSVTTGSGFGASRIGTGIYTVSFPTPFTSQPTVTVTVEGASPRLATCANVGTTSVEIRTFDSTTGAAVDEAFHFIAIGPR